MKIIDSHVHFWNIEKFNYPWLDFAQSINKTMQPDNLYNVCPSLSGLIFVQSDCDTLQALQEVDWVNSLRNNSLIPILGIVAYAAIENGNTIKSYLEQLLLKPNVVGIRRSIQNEPNFLWNNSNYIDGMLLASNLGLTIDICAMQNQLDQLFPLLKLACKENPSIKIVLDHMGKPNIKNNQFEEWKNSISKIAELPNVYCKISGLVTEADWLNWCSEEITPYIKYVLNVFGIDRCLYGGDWPVVNLAGGYQKWFSYLFSTFGDDKKFQRKVLSENSLHFYNLHTH